MTLQLLMASLWRVKGSWSCRKCVSVCSRSYTESIKVWTNLFREPETSGFWSSMTGQTRRLILACPSCLEHQPRQKQAAVSPVITNNAMQNLGCDIIQHKGWWYSCIVDYHTGYPWVRPIKNQEADTVIEHIFSVSAASLVTLQR